MHKKEIRMLGIDDSPFDKFKKGRCLVVGVVMRGGRWLEGVLSTKVSVDGSDATKKLAKMVNRSRFKPQLQCIFLNGIAVGGFNIINIRELQKKTRLPVIVVVRRMPDIKNIKKVLVKLKKGRKIRLIEEAGRVLKIGKIFVQLSGITEDAARDMLKVACTRSLVPEPMRAAHIIASGIVKGESKGKA